MMTNHTCLDYKLEQQCYESLLLVRCVKVQVCRLTQWWWRTLTLMTTKKKKTGPHSTLIFHVCNSCLWHISLSKLAAKCIILLVYDFNVFFFLLLHWRYDDITRKDFLIYNISNIFRKCVFPHLFLMYIKMYLQ